MHRRGVGECAPTARLDERLTDKTYPRKLSHLSHLSHCETLETSHLSYLSHCETFETLETLGLRKKKEKFPPNPFIRESKKNLFLPNPPSSKGGLMQQQLLLFDIGQKGNNLRQLREVMVIAIRSRHIRPPAQEHLLALVCTRVTNHRCERVTQRMEGYHLLSIARNACACGLINQTL